MIRFDSEQLHAETDILKTARADRVVISRPLVSAGMIAKEPAVTPRAALRIVDELGLREMTGRGRFRACGVSDLYQIFRVHRYSF